MQSLSLAGTSLPENDTDYLILAGPTAVGKTACSLELAEQTPVEIVSADSRQVYRGMNIGTATPEADLLERIPHHFINELDPETVWNAGAFYKAARERIRQILDRHRLPVVVGGAGLYLEALRFGFFSEKGRDPEIRKQYQLRLAEIGAEALWEGASDEGFLFGYDE